MEQKKQETTTQLKIMCSKYIVLKKTGAAPLPSYTATPRETSLKEERRSLTRPLAPPAPLFYRGGLITPNPPASPCVETAFFEISVFPHAQTGRKKENSPNSELQTPRTIK